MTFSLSSIPLNSSLTPRLVDPLWLRIDVPKDENSELTKMEKEHGDWLKSLGDRDLGLLPIGKTTPETDDDEEEDDEEEVSSFATILIQPKPCTYLSNFLYFSLSNYRAKGTILFHMMTKMTMQRWI